MVKSCGLTKSQLADIQTLEKRCNQFEGLTMKLNPYRLYHRPPDELNDFLYYEANQLIGYLALYIFNREEIEISAMTDPTSRRQGIFKKLLMEASQEVKKRHIPDLLFICEPVSTSGQAALQAIGCNYDYSEYKMNLQEFIFRSPPVPNLSLEIAQEEDLFALARMDSICFDYPIEDTYLRVSRDMVKPDRKIWIAKVNQKKVGKIQATILEKEIYINAFCVLPEFQGLGYGTSILGYTLSLLQSEPYTISLEVACQNKQALSLYQQYGFEISTVYDYYRLPVEQIQG